MPASGWISRLPEHLGRSPAQDSVETGASTSRSREAPEGEQADHLQLGEPSDPAHNHRNRESLRVSWIRSVPGARDTLRAHAQIPQTQGSPGQGRGSSCEGRSEQLVGMGNQAPSTKRTLSIEGRPLSGEERPRARLRSPAFTPPPCGSIFPA